MTCAITTSILGCMATLFLFARYILYAEIPTAVKVVWAAAALLAGCIPLFVGYNFENVFGRFYGFYRYSLYFIYITAIILLTFTIIGDLCRIVIKTAAPSLLPAAAKSTAAILFLSLAAAVWALHEGTKIPAVKTVILSSPKIKQEMTIAVLSDIHIHRVINPAKVKAIIDRTNEQNPDVVLLDGDIIDDDTDKVTEISALLRNLNSKHGIYFVTGNHEFYAGYQSTTDALKSLGFKFLENDGIDLGNVYLAGIPDMFSGGFYHKNADISGAFKQSAPGQYRILASHTPFDFGSGNDFDLEISGHTHGGQIFPFHIFTKLYNKYLSGLYTMSNGAQIYVSNGAGQWGPQMRFLAPSEITILKLLPQTTSSGE